jgi:hypothetical protein
MAGYEARAKYPNSVACLESVHQELNPHYDEAHKVLNKTAVKVKP